ncbi:hypothetical protein PHYPSEUDO_015394 [Phytophthora pseudosyringae]|uniref:BHLH domain-containing protein n=1 Tax=Phytophthora pseudosyringae TaxID=221518 RepID=A0A8T1V842_9STRA|nr:hypothetical protein PHYPSEUDO_015394 [Phytophthora pseudosyringae]
MSVNGYAASSARRYDQPRDDGRPALYLQPHAMADDYNQLMHAPQHGAVKYEPGAPYYPPPPAALHVSSDYQPVPGSAASTPPSGAKRSREELNMKEKQRMFKLNERISQLRALLDEAGVQSKKNKQSVLDNTVHYIELLRGDLVVARQKAERAEKQAETFRARAPQGVDRAASGVFEKTTTPRVVVDMDMATVVFNAAFVEFAGLSELALKKKKTLRPYLCADQAKLDAIVKKLRETKQSVSALVNASTTGKGEVAVNLVAAVVSDDCGKAANVEFSLIPVDTQQLQRQRPWAPKRQKTKVGGGGGATEAAAMRSKTTDEPAIYVQL